MGKNAGGEVDGGTLVAIVLLILALLGAFYLLVVRGGGGDGELDVDVQIEDSTGRVGDSIGHIPSSAEAVAERLA